MESILLYIKQVLIQRKARVVQLLSRAVSGGLLAIAGQIQSQPPDSAALAGTTDAIAVATVALAIFLLDLLIHKMRYGGVVNDTNANANANTNANTDTKRRKKSK